jgi:amino acid transporter
MPVIALIIIIIILGLTGLRLSVASERNIGKATGWLLMGVTAGLIVWLIMAFTWAPMKADGRFYVLQEINCTDGGKIQVASTEQGILNVTKQFGKLLDMKKRIYRKSAEPNMGIYGFGWYEWCYEQ